MNKSQLSETDICDKYITPALVTAGWRAMDQIYREFPLRAGRVVVRGNKAQRDKSTVLRADYALFYKADIPIATIEAKDIVTQDYAVNRVLMLLAEQLTTDFGKGFAVQSLRNYHQFYQSIPAEAIRSTPWSELGWSQIKVLMRVPADTSPGCPPRPSCKPNSPATARCWKARAATRRIFKSILISGKSS